MDSRQAGPKGPRGAAGTMLLPALALAAIVLLAAVAPVRAADPAATSSTGAGTSAGAAALPAAAPTDDVRSTPAAGAMGQPGAGAMSPPAAGAMGQSVAVALSAGAQQAAEHAAGSEPLTLVRIAILNATGKPGGANKVALLLSEVKRRALEDQIGLQIAVVNLSTAEGVHPGPSVLYYRPEFLRAALAMARAIPGGQLIQPMRPAGLKRAGVDVEIVVGEDLP